MVIAEALTKIKDLEKERGELQDKLSSMIFLPDDMTSEPIETILDEYENITDEIARLKTNIIETNVNTIVEHDGHAFNLMRVIKMIGVLRNLEEFHRRIAKQIDTPSNRYLGGVFGEERIKLRANFTKTSAEFLDKAKEYRDTARKLEKLLIKKNWQTELVS